MALPRLLAIDDEVQLLRALERMLRKAFDVTTVSTIGEGAQLLAATSFDIILCDVHMPMVDAEAFVATLPASTASHVIFMSGDEAPEDDAALAHPRLVKPFTVEELLRAIACLCPAAA